jgi:hypothetical protein
MRQNTVDPRMPWALSGYADLLRCKQPTCIKWGLLWRSSIAVCWLRGWLLLVPAACR